MADRYSPELRSALMAKVKSRNTRIELRVRRLLHAAGYRFRVNMKGLPGTPDIAFTKRKKAIFVHGCFWHGHEGCKRSTLPATRREFWAAKVDRNKERDATNYAKLMALGWSALTIWECEMTDDNTLAFAFLWFEEVRGESLVTSRKMSSHRDRTSGLDHEAARTMQYQ